MQIVVLAGTAEVVLIFLAVLRLGGDGDIALGLGVGDLHVVGQKILGEEPGGQDFLRIGLVEHADGGPLRDHGGVPGIKLWNRQHRRLKLHHLVGADIQQGGVRAHPGRAGGGVHREDALAGVEEVCGVA